MTSKAQLRQTLRARRRALSTQQQSIAARGIIKQLNKLASFRKARHIACYLENDGELGTQPLRRDCQGRGIACYLPVVHAEAGHFSMRFHHHRHGQSGGFGGGLFAQDRKGVEPWRGFGYVGR